MVPSGEVTHDTIVSLAAELGEGDLVIDGGNSRYTEDGPHADLLSAKGVGFIDAGVSGGIWGLTAGYGLMVGGSDDDVARAMPIFDTLRPPGPQEDGFVHAGPVGAGHFAKMVHNGIEYALMTAYAEGYEMLDAEDLIKDPQAVYQAWTNGTVVRSWLQQLLAKALKEDPELSDISRLHGGFRRGSLDGRGGDPAAGARSRDRRVVVRTLPVPAGRLADHEGRRRTAQPVRWPRRPEGQQVGIACRRAGAKRLGERSLYVRHLGLTDFRSWPRVDVELDPGRTVFIGPNGFGKTNLVEALWYSSTLGSHRVASDAPLIREGADRAVVSTIVVNEGRELAVDLEITAGKANKARLNRSPVRSAREILGVLSAVLFAPEDLALVRGEPGERRRYLDELATTRRPAIAGVRADYDKVLRQRTALLKTAAAARYRGDSGALETLDVWDRHLAVHGAELIAARVQLVNDLAPEVEKAYQVLAAGVAHRGDSLPKWRRGRRARG